MEIPVSPSFVRLYKMLENQIYSQNFYNRFPKCSFGLKNVILGPVASENDVISSMFDSSPGLDPKQAYLGNNVQINNY